MAIIISFLLLVVVISIGYADHNINACHVSLNIPNKKKRNLPFSAVCSKYPNEEFAIDLYRCQNTCEQYGRTWDCPDYKPYGDCYCKKGFARIKEDGECVSVKNNPKCAARLPITPMSCRKRGEIYVEELDLGACDMRTCLTSQCAFLSRGSTAKWSPHCECLRYYERRLSNGTCVSETHPLCVAEGQPSPERCTAIGQIYQVNAPCEKRSGGPDLCPRKDGDCLCPPGKVEIEWGFLESVPTYACL